MKKFIVICLCLLFMLFMPYPAYTQDSIANEPSQVKMVMDRLEYLQTETNWIESYKQGVFDCSNMSALLTIIFCEYQTKYVFFDRKESYHCLVSIFLDGEWYWIEPTTLRLIKSDLIYKVPKEEFSTIAEIVNNIDVGKQEFNINIDYITKNVFNKQVKKE